MKLRQSVLQKRFFLKNALNCNGRWLEDRDAEAFRAEVLSCGTFEAPRFHDFGFGLGIELWVLSFEFHGCGFGYGGSESGVDKLEFGVQTVGCGVQRSGLRI
jgi:hypothetical protein